MEMTKTLSQIQDMPANIHRRTAFSQHILDRLVYPGKAFLVQYTDNDTIKIIGNTEAERIWLNFCSREGDTERDYIEFKPLRLEVRISHLTEKDVSNIVELLNREIASSIRANRSMCTVQ